MSILCTNFCICIYVDTVYKSCMIPYRHSQSRVRAWYTHLYIYMYILIYIYTHIHTYIYIYIYIYIHIYINTYIYIHICSTFIYTVTNTRHTYLNVTHKHIHTVTNTQHTYLHANHTQTYSHKHTTHISTCEHTSACACMCIHLHILCRDLLIHMWSHWDTSRSAQYLQVYIHTRPNIHTYTP